MIKIALFSDIHGNYQALEAIVNDIKKRNDIDEVMCLGDTIAMGPNPKECMELVMNENITMVLGNHEEYYLKGAENFSEVGNGERKHQVWVRNQLNKEIKEVLNKKPYLIKKQIGDHTYAFIHYARKNNRFIYIDEARTVKNLDQMFSEVKADVIFYGHEHHLEQTKVDGKSTYICVGSSGCRIDELTYYTVLTFEDSDFKIERVNLKYKHETFLRSMAVKDYPDKKFISKQFFGIV